MAVVSDSNSWGHASAAEQLAWLAAEADAAITVLGGEGSWSKYSVENLWSENREGILENLKPRSCRPTKTGPQPGAYVLDLDNGSLQHPFEAAKRLRKHWAEQGWAITDVVTPGSSQRELDYFRADRADGAMLALTASEYNLSLQILTFGSDGNMTE